MVASYLAQLDDAARMCERDCEHQHDRETIRQHRNRMSAIKSNAKKKKEMELLEARHKLLLKQHKHLKKRIYALIDELTLHGVSLIDCECLIPYLQVLNSLLLERPEPHFYAFLRTIYPPIPQTPISFMLQSHHDSHITYPTQLHFPHALLSPPSIIRGEMRDKPSRQHETMQILYQPLIPNRQCQEMLDVEKHVHFFPRGTA